MNVFHLVLYSTVRIRTVYCQTIHFTTAKNYTESFELFKV